MSKTQTFEYSVFVIGYTNDYTTNVENKLNALAQKGWEFLQCYTNAHHAIVAILKRPLKDEQSS